MSLSNRIHSIVVPASAANFTAHTYTMVYAGAAATPTINGVAIPMVAGSSLNIKVKTITPTGNVFLFGENNNVYNPGNVIL